MSTIQEAKTDLEAILKARADGRPIDPELLKRVRDRSAALRIKVEDDFSLRLLRELRNE